MEIDIISPSKAIIKKYTYEELESARQELTYTNKAVAFEIKRASNNFWFRRQNEEKWQLHIDNLKKKLKRTLVFQDLDGSISIYPGSIPYLTSKNLKIKNSIEYKTPKKVAWKKPLPFELYPYQEESWKELIDIKHGNVELCTGSGKSAIILKICRETGFKTAIIAPSKSIFEELLAKFEYHFGKDKVGAFGNGKKKIGKLFTICISDSICNVKEGTEEWDFFSNLDCILVDESHTFAAETLEEICYGVLVNVPYRMFFSGTQTRNDGGEKLLQSIIGKTVHTLSTADAIKGGYICNHVYRIVNIESSNPNYGSDDALDMKRAHFLKNRNICAFIAKLANSDAIARKRQTLVLVDELEQIAMLIKLLKVPYAYAHSEKKKERLLEVGLEKVNTQESVEKFNKAEAMVLIGTNCISTGTNIFPTHHTFNWQGGSSEIKTKQGAIGRSVRLGSSNPWASKCQPKDFATIWDFNVYDIFLMNKHLKERVIFYRESGTEIKVINLTK